MTTTVSERAADPDVAADVPPRRGARLLRGRPDDPRWARPALAVLLVVTGVTYLWRLGASGWANSFYAAAVQAGTQSWKAWLFGSLDSANLITVDKPPAALWVMGLSGRLFGFSSWSMLVPQALMGVGAVALTYATVRRWSGPRTALAAAALLAFTPVAVLMFRFNNPDALLVLCMVAAAYTTTRAVDAAGTGRGRGGSRGPARWSASASSPRCCRSRWSSRPSAWSTCWSPRRRCADGSSTWSPPSPPSSSRRGGSSCSSSCGRRPRAPTSAARPPTRCSSSPWVTTARPASSAAPATAAAPARDPGDCRAVGPARPGAVSVRPGARVVRGAGVSAARRARGACSPRSSPVRPRGCCRPRWCCSSPACGSPAARHAPTDPEPCWCSAGPGCSCTPWSSAR